MLFVQKLKWPHQLRVPQPGKRLYDPLKDRSNVAFYKGNDLTRKNKRQLSPGKGSGGAGSIDNNGSGSAEDTVGWSIATGVRKKLQ